MNNPTSALDAVRNYQTQVDEDGTLIGVSRQALDEVITDYDALAARLARDTKSHTDLLDAAWADLDAAKARLAEAERRIAEALAYDDDMDKTTRSILDGSRQFDLRPTDSASAQETDSHE